MLKNSQRDSLGNQGQLSLLYSEKCQVRFSIEKDTNKLGDMEFDAKLQHDFKSYLSVEDLKLIYIQHYLIK